MPPTSAVTGVDRESNSPQLFAAQLRLLYANANLGVAVTLSAACILCGLQWGIVPRVHILVWWLYMVSVAGLRWLLARRYQQAAPTTAHWTKWQTAFAIAAGFSGAGWGAAGVLLYPHAHLINQVLLFFVLGGMMLGASSLLAALPEAFLAFLVPAGMIPAIRLLFEGDKTHLAMGVLACIFTVATIVATGRMHRMILSSLRLQFENHELVAELRAANQQTAALNLELEKRVQERTAALEHAAEQLREQIVQRQQTEEELLRARKLESLGVLAGGIAHDFNNFLTVVQGNIEVAKAELPEDDAACGFLDQAANACQRAKFLSSQLLTFAKGGSPVRRVVSVAQLVIDAVQLARTGSHVGIHMDIADGLWSAEVDPGQIGQVFHNILINAREAMPAGTAIEVRAKNVPTPRNTDSDDPHVRVSIRDYGSGISPEILKRIFDPYFTTKPGGNGLGLATAYAIVVKHGGQITASSEPGAGAEFTVDLPASTKTPTPAASAQTAHPGTGRLLVMDDDPSLRVLFQAVLSQLGYDVDTAAHGVEAIELYQRAQAEDKAFDAVLLDLTVPGGMGGMEVATKLKALYPAAKLIVSSGYSDAPVMSHYADYGFDAVIEKPWTVQEMSGVLRTVLLSDALR